MALTAIAARHVRPLAAWRPAFLRKIMKQAHKNHTVYWEVYQLSSKDDGRLAIEDLPPITPVWFSKGTFDAIRGKDYFGLVRDSSENSRRDLTGIGAAGFDDGGAASGTCEVRDAVADNRPENCAALDDQSEATDILVDLGVVFDKFLVDETRAVLVSFGEYSISVMCEHGRVYVFDSHSRDKLGIPDEDGEGFLMEVNSIEALKLYCGRVYKGKQYHATSIEIKRLD